MSQKPVTRKTAAEKVVKEIRRATRKQHSAEEKIALVLAGLRDEDSITELCRREVIAQICRSSRGLCALGSGGRLRFIEVKGRVAGAETVTVTKNEILTSLNKPDAFILALVEFLDENNHRVHYVRRPFEGRGVSTDFKETGVLASFADLISRAALPS